MKTTITFKSGTKTVAEIEGRRMPPLYMVPDDIKDIVETEQFLEILLGYRCHINVSQSFSQSYKASQDS